MSDFSNLEHVLFTVFGFSSFRPPQREIVQSILNQQDTLAILPTGAGKSLCFQLPAVMLTGTTLVISPLISLMKDQVEHCEAKGIPAGYLSSAQTIQAQNDTLELFRLGKLKLMYVSPERLQSRRFLVACQEVTIPLLVVDEAHCISTWGHDFRPNYRLIPQFINSREKRPTVAAFTASATPQTQADICNNLQLHKPQRFLTTFRRPNLSLSVIPTPDSFHKDLYVLRLLKQFPNQTLLIYTATRERCEYIVTLIKQFFPDIPAACYHAGLEKTERERVQTQFQSGKIQVIAATSAFGMGVDKADVRCVIHYQLPPSLEDYYQEAGRAGRDGQASKCYLLASQSDVSIQQEMIPIKNQRHNLNKLKKLLNFTNSRHCRQSLISHYFGETNTEPCHTCDNCLKNRPSIPLLQLATQSEINHLSHLLTWRKNQAKQQRTSETKIMSDRVLCQIALIQPQSECELLNLAGVGKGWAESYLRFSSGTISLP